jgi:hypothetical protein
MKGEKYACWNEPLPDRVPVSNGATAKSSKLKPAEASLGARSDGNDATANTQTRKADMDRTPERARERSHAEG